MILVSWPFLDNLSAICITASAEPPLSSRVMIWSILIFTFLKSVKLCAMRADGKICFFFQNTSEFQSFLAIPYLFKTSLFYIANAEIE